jgi:basic membrane protein A
VAQEKCKDLANSQIGQGSDVVFQVAGGCGLGALEAAKEKGVWGIGVDKDQKDVNDRVLASAIKVVDQAVFRTAQSVQDGSFKGGEDVAFGLAEDGVGIASIHESVPQEVQDEVQAQAEKIKNGEVTVNDTVE